MSSSVDSSDIESEDEAQTRNITAEAQGITDNLLPQKSGFRYNACYDEFIAWKLKNKINSLSEDVLLVYFNEQSQKMKASTLWSRWSMLRSVILLKDGININEYKRLKTFMKNKSKGFIAKKAQILSFADITRFIDEAPDNFYLAMKVVLIFGICGALRSVEFCTINTNDVEDTGTQFIVTVRDTKNYYPRSFVIGCNFYPKVKLYTAQRPDDMDSNRFFINYQKGKCTRQVIGKNKISEIPKTIALYLNLENAASYTGHCFRRTSATLLANSGATLLTLKQHGGWRSSTVAEGYVQNSIGNKKKIFDQIVNAEPSTSTGIYHTAITASSIESRQQPASSIESRQQPASSIESRQQPASSIESQQQRASSIESRQQPASSVENSEEPVAAKEETRPAVTPQQKSPSSVTKVPLKSIENFEAATTSGKATKRTNNGKKKSTAVMDADGIEALNLDNSVLKIKNCKVRQLTVNYCSCKCNAKEN